MYLTGTLLRGVMVVVLLANSCGKRRCNYRAIVGSYTEVILVELQKLNLTGPFNTPKERDPCPSGKARHILVSIYRVTQKMRCRRTGEQQLDIEKPLQSMEQLIIHNCRPDYLVSLEKDSQE